MVVERHCNLAIIIIIVLLNYRSEFCFSEWIRVFVEIIFYYVAMSKHGPMKPLNNYRATLYSWLQIISVNPLINREYTP